MKKSDLAFALFTSEVLVFILAALMSASFVKKKQRNAKERNVDFLFPKCQTHAYTRFENGCCENSTQKLLTKSSTEEKNKHVICQPRSVRIGKNCARVLEYGPSPKLNSCAATKTALGNKQF